MKGGPKERNPYSKGPYSIWGGLIEGGGGGFIITRSTLRWGGLGLGSFLRPVAGVKGMEDWVWGLGFRV